jgi:hypothetical protein
MPPLCVRSPCIIVPGDTIQGGILFKKIRYLFLSYFFACFAFIKNSHLFRAQEYGNKICEPKPPKLPFTQVLQQHRIRSSRRELKLTLGIHYVKEWREFFSLCRASIWENPVKRRNTVTILAEKRLCFDE